MSPTLLVSPSPVCGPVCSPILRSHLPARQNLQLPGLCACQSPPLRPPTHCPPPLRNSSDNTVDSRPAKPGLFPRNPFLRISLNLWAWAGSKIALFCSELFFIVILLKIWSQDVLGPWLSLGLGGFPCGQGNGLEVVLVGGEERPGRKAPACSDRGSGQGCVGGALTEPGVSRRGRGVLLGSWCFLRGRREGPQYSARMLHGPIIC